MGEVVNPPEQAPEAGGILASLSLPSTSFCWGSHWADGILRNLTYAARNVQGNQEGRGSLRYEFLRMDVY